MASKKTPTAAPAVDTPAPLMIRTYPNGDRRVGVVIAAGSRGEGDHAKDLVQFIELADVAGSVSIDSADVEPLAVAEL